MKGGGIRANRCCLTKDHHHQRTDRPASASPWKPAKFPSERVFPALLTSVPRPPGGGRCSCFRQEQRWVRKPCLAQAGGDSVGVEPTVMSRVGYSGTIILGAPQQRRRACLPLMSSSRFFIILEEEQSQHLSQRWRPAGGAASPIITDQLTSGARPVW